MQPRKAAVIVLGLALAAHGLGAQTGLSRVGATESTAREIVMSGINGLFSLGTVSKAFLALPAAARAAAVTELVAWAKVYLNSAIFKKAWAAERESHKPETTTRGTVDDELKAMVAEQQTGIDEMKKMLPMVPPADRAAMQEQIKQMEATLKNPEHLARMREMVVLDRAGRETEHQDALKRWEERYPADHNVLLARRLKDFVAASADVNFDAALVTTGRVRRFADPQYEAKPPAWKLCYRAGREATQAARAAAAAWLTELAPLRAQR